jgi:hypothetical protein
LPSHILGSLDELHRKMSRVYDKHFRNNDITEDLLSIYRAIVVYGSWRNPGASFDPAISKGLARRAIQVCLRRVTEGEVDPSWRIVSIAAPALETLAMEVASEQNKAGIQMWLAAWVAIKAAIGEASGEHWSYPSNAVWSANSPFHFAKIAGSADDDLLLDKLYKRSLSQITSATYESLLSTLMDSLILPTGSVGKVAVASLQACSLLLDLQINGEFSRTSHILAEILRVRVQAPARSSNYT